MNTFNSDKVKKIFKEGLKLASKTKEYDQKRFEGFWEAAIKAMDRRSQLMELGYINSFVVYKETSSTEFGIRAWRECKVEDYFRFILATQYLGLRQKIALKFSNVEVF